MGEIRFDHIAIGTKDMADAPAVLAGILGGVPTEGQESGVFRWGLWKFEGGGGIEILEPTGEDGFLHRFLAQRGPGVHHVTFTVPSLVAACERARRHGYDVVGYDDSDPSWKEAFLHPRQALGIVVQLAESAAPETSAPTWQPPPSPPDPPPPVRIVGLLLVARTRERAITQWERVLKGRRTDRADGALEFRWPRSPMRIAVLIDPAREEGPVAIEFAADREIDIGEGRLPLLGAAFARVPLSAPA